MVAVAIEASATSNPRERLAVTGRGVRVWRPVAGAIAAAAGTDAATGRGSAVLTVAP